MCNKSKHKSLRVLIVSGGKEWKRENEKSSSMAAFFAEYLRGWNLNSLKSSCAKKTYMMKDYSKWIYVFNTLESLEFIIRSQSCRLKCHLLWTVLLSCDDILNTFNDKTVKLFTFQHNISGSWTMNRKEQLKL